MRTLMPTVESAQSDAAVRPLGQPLHLILIAHDNAQSIETTLRRLASYCHKVAPDEYRITVIDQDSSDRTLALAELVSRDMSGIRVLHSYPEQLSETLRSLSLEANSVVALMNMAHSATPQLLQDGIHAVSELSWDLVAIADPGNLETSEHPVLSSWRLAAHRMRNSLRMNNRDDLTAVIASEATMKKSFSGSEYSESSEILAQVLAVAHKNKMRYLVHNRSIDS